MTDNNRILYFYSSLSKGAGMERVLTTKMNWFSQNGYNVHIALLDDTKPFFALSRDIKKHKLKNDSYCLLDQIQCLVEAIDPFVVISTCSYEMPYLWKVKHPCKKIIEFHYTYNYLSHLVNAHPSSPLKPLRLLRAKLRQKKERSLLKRYDYIVLLTQRDRALWGPKYNTVVIPNPLSFSYPSVFLDLKAKQILGCGRFTPQKGFDLLIKSFVPIAKKHPDWTLKIIGEGELMTDYQLLIDQYDLDKQVFLKSPQVEIEEELRKSAFFVLSSKYEGFGLVLVEAMEMGVPCVSYDCECGPSEIITHQKDGFLVSPGDKLSLTKKMELLITNEQLRQTMGYEAKQNVKRFSIETIGEQWKTFFETIQK